MCLLSYLQAALSDERVGRNFLVVTTKDAHGMSSRYTKPLMP